ncbi:arylsulfatase B-like isoform X1 [Lineus longissimus]|uniref:arylsulfatase B-like isoform X1 n=1 Tax=Lineus longissimus TaxID=88925 RepID=UPI002B4E0FED
MHQTCSTLDFAALFNCLLLAGCVVATTRPHVVLIVADDLGWNDVSFHGSQQIPTPNLDRFGHAGIILNNYYTQHICTPTRSCLMTGRYPIHLGLQHSVIVGSQPYGLGLNETILPQYLKSLNYSTHIVGKWHLGFFAKEYTPTYRGFDDHFGYWLGAEDYWDHTAEGSSIREWGLDFRRNMDVVRDEFGQYSTELFTREAENLIRKHNQSQPMFLYMAHQAVHRGNYPDPMQVPYKYYERFPHIQDPGRRKYAGMVSALDESFGNVTRALNETGMLNNSIIIFTTDNGGPAAGFDSNHASNYPLRGLKATLWEGGVRGPGFIYSNLLKNSGRTSNQLMHVSDWLPTILSAIDADIKPNNPDGFDMWPTLNHGLESPRKEILHNIDPTDNNAAIRVGDYKAIMGSQSSRNSWYFPEQVSEELEKMDVHNSHDYSPNFIKQFKMKYDGDYDTLTLQDIVNHLNKITLKLTQKYPYINKTRDSPMESPFVVNCGPFPSNARTNCRPGDAPCLFNVKLDPCEYHNLADHEPEVLDLLLFRMSLYSESAVPIRNLPEDPMGYPKNHDLVWTSWVNLTQAELYP